jgi:ribosomal protein S27E
MKIICPECNAENETTAAPGEAIGCAVCGKFFRTPAAGAVATSAEPAKLLLRRSAIRCQAVWSYVVAMLAAVAFGLTFLGSVAETLQSEPALMGYVWSGIFLAICGVAIIIHQLIHIRANTEK